MAEMLESTEPTKYSDAKEAQNENRAWREREVLEDFCELEL